MSSKAMSFDVLCLILGGGKGTRLWPLTKDRAKPAVPIGGKYRLVDICVSNCLNSGLHHIAVLTQFNSVSLNRHIADTYHFDLFHAGGVQILAAEQTNRVSDWYQGSADAVRKHLEDICSTNTRDVLILAGDHLYRMDYSKLVVYQRENHADVTVAVKRVAQEDVSRFGILKRTGDGRVTAFFEKPSDSERLSQLLDSSASEPRFLASMGIYVFRTPILCELLDSSHVDFGRDLIPAAIKSHRVLAYPFDGYWEDVGTIRSYYEASLALVRPAPPFTFNDAVWPVYTRPRFLPGSRLIDVRCSNVLLADGCVLEKAEIENSLIGNRSAVQRDAIIRDTVLMGASYNETKTDTECHLRDVPALGIGAGSRIAGAIIDRNARIGAGVTIQPFPSGTNIDTADWMVRDGIVVIPHHTLIPAGSRISP